MQTVRAEFGTACRDQSPKLSSLIIQSAMMFKLLRHIRSGTLSDVSIKWLQSRFNSARWAFAGYTVFPLSPRGSLKLYRDSRLSS